MSTSTIDSPATPPTASRPTLPPWQRVLVEQIRVTGIALRKPVMLVAAFGLLATILIVLKIASRGLTFDLDAEPSPIYGLVGAVLPVVVWARDERFGPAFLWTLPVDRRQHALLKVFAGWLWLVGGIALSLLWLVAITLASGGEVLPAEMINLHNGPIPVSGAVDPAALTEVRWAPGLLLAAVPFTAATATYLLSSAVWLGSRQPIRLAIGLLLSYALATVVCGVAAEQLGMTWLLHAPERALAFVMEAPYGLDALLTARTATLDTGLVLPTGERLSVWSSMPDLAHWGWATLLWAGAGLIGLLIATSRHRERRRA